MPLSELEYRQMTLAAVKAQDPSDLAAQFPLLSSQQEAFNALAKDQMIIEKHLITLQKPAELKSDKPSIIRKLHQIFSSQPTRVSQL